jgi:hypothetical protein
MSKRTIALVESPTQLLNVAEWAYATGHCDGLRVAVLAPRDRHTVRQLDAVGELVAAIGLDVRAYPVRSRSAGAATGLVRALRDVARAERLVIGDPFSRFIQTLLPTAGADEVVVVDDGTATWEFARCIDAAEPLLRWGASPSGPSTRAARAARLLSPSLTRRLTVFSCLADTTPLAATAIANGYEWTRSRNRPAVLEDEIDVLGVSLVDNGVVERRPYVDAVGELARLRAPVRYIAHRRESENLVAQVAALPDVRVVRLDLPVELALRRGPVARHVVTFPSTAAHTLPIVLADAGVSVTMRRIEPGWFTPATTVRARRFVARIGRPASPPYVPRVTAV